MLTELKGLCDWYNQERIKLDYDPFKAAAALQHRLISIHAFGDNNGRLSRMLMNWSLENDHLEPSVVYDPSDDLFNSEEDWAKQVQFGSQFVRKQQQDRQGALESIGEEDPAFMLGIDQQKTFYDAVYRQLEGAITPSPTDANTHQSYEQFWQQFGEEYRQFKASTTSSEPLQNTASDHERNRASEPELMVQGGLIPESYIELVKSGKPLPESIRNSFFGSLKLFRGGISSRQLTDRDLCQMFTNYIGIGTGYKALEDSYTSALSPRTVSSEIIAKELSSYNQTLAADYIAYKNEKSRHRVDNTQEEAGFNSQLAKLIGIHTGDESHRGSPFTSTSTREDLGDVWGNAFHILSPDGDSSLLHAHGITITSKVPLYGSIQSFSNEGQDNKSSIPMLAHNDAFQFKYPLEKEVLVAGGIDPNAIEVVKVFDNQSKSILEYVPAMMATREMVNGQIHITIKNYLESKARKYAFNPQSRNFELLDESEIDGADDGIYLNNGKLSFYDHSDLESSPDIGEDDDPSENNSDEQYQSANIEEIKAHLTAGTASLIEIEDLITSGEGQMVIENIDKIAVDHTFIAEKLLLYSLDTAVIKNLDHFHVDQGKIAMLLIQLSQGEMVIQNLDAFKDVYHTFIAQCLINNGQIDVLADNLSSLSDLDKVIAQTLINNGYAEQVSANRDHFFDLDESILQQLEASDFGSNEQYTNSLDEAMMAHVAEGTANMQEIDGLIMDGYGNVVVDNITHIDPALHPVIAQKLITNGWSSYLVENLGNFEGLDQNDIAKRIIDNYDGWMVAQNLSKFDRVDPNFIAQQMIDRDQAHDLATYLKYFANLDKSIAQQLINLDEGYEVKLHLDRFASLDESILKQLDSAETSTSASKTAKSEAQMLSHLSEGTASIEEIRQLIHQGKGWEVAQNIEHVNAENHAEIAARLIEYNFGMALINYLHLFKNLNHQAIAEQLIDRDQCYMVAENLNSFENVDHNAIAHQLVDRGYTSLLAINLYNFSGLDNNIAQQLIDNHFAYEVEKHLTSFSHLDESISKQLMAY